MPTTFVPRVAIDRPYMPMFMLPPAAKNILRSANVKRPVPAKHEETGNQSYGAATNVPTVPNMQTDEIKRTTRL